MDERVQRPELELPAITAWARAELTGYSDADLAAVVEEWSRSQRTRRELHWLEGALSRRQQAAVRSSFGATTGRQDRNATRTGRRRSTFGHLPGPWSAAE